MTDVCIIDITKFYNNDPDYFKIYDNSFGFTGSDCLDHGIIRAKNGNFWIMSSGRSLPDPKNLYQISSPENQCYDINFRPTADMGSFRIPDCSTTSGRI
jgi:hypothetical protein